MSPATLASAAIVFSWTAAVSAQTQVLHERFKLIASDGEPLDQFGWSVAVGDDFVICGAWRNGPFIGAAYVFDTVTGEETRKIVPDDADFRDHFGYSVAMDGGVVAAASPLDDDQGHDAGAAYLFDMSTGAQLFKLLPDDGEVNNAFGSGGIAMHDGVVAVGTPVENSYSGSAFLFDALTGTQLVKLIPEDIAGSDWFGDSIDIDQGIVVVGARWDDDNGMDSGSAYLFDASTGAQLLKLLPDDGRVDQWFGYSVAIADGIVVVGALRDEDGGTGAGAAYLFDASSGVQIAKLLGSYFAQFGFAVGIDNGVIAIGAPNSRRTVYLFDASTGEEIATLTASDGAVGDLFGSSVAIHDTLVVVGAYQDDDNGENSGSVYLFDIGCLISPANMNGDNILDFFDVLCFLNAFSSQQESADFVEDGVFDFFDVQAFLAAYAVGCS